MSKLGKKPFMAAFLDLMDEDQISRVATLLNTKPNGGVIYDLTKQGNRWLPKSAPATDEGKISLCSVRIAQLQTYQGLLMYLDTDKCVFVGYEDGREGNKLPVFNIDPINNVYVPIEEGLTAEEMRRMVEDRLITAGAIVPENVKFTVSNIKTLNDDQINDLKVGDMVAKQDSTGKHIYVVTYKKDNTGICLTYADASVVETQSYDYTEGHWVYNSEDKTSFADIGGLPEVTADDNGKVLEVIAGAWGKGGKKVNIIDAPSSTTLDDETIAKIREGVFINGDFLGYHNPILIPAQPVGVLEGFYGGLLIGTAGYPQQGAVLAGFTINTSKVISVHSNSISFNVGYSGRITIKGLYSLNEKLIPNYPASTGTFTLKCVDGVLTWVQDV